MTQPQLDVDAADPYAQAPHQDVKIDDDQGAAEDGHAAVEPGKGFHWQSSLRQTIRLIPVPAETETARILLNSQGQTDEDILPRLPVEAARRRPGAAGAADRPDGRRLRDPRDVAQTIGLLYRDGGTYTVTELGIAVRRWLPDLNERNWPVLGTHAAYTLAACQLRNPTRGGQKYPLGTEVFPFVYIWRAMLALDGMLSSDELNRAVLRTSDPDSLGQAIARIRRRRETNGPLADLGDETVLGERKNDRLIPWISLASFGYFFIQPKDKTHYYRLRPEAARLLTGPARARNAHYEFASTADYVRYLSDCASLPKDMR